MGNSYQLGKPCKIAAPSIDKDLTVPSGNQISANLLRLQPNGTKKSSKLYGIRATALKVIEQSRRGQAVVLDAVSWKRSPQ
ncbi:hypothetical protein LC653_43115, partial [Nostoc sp. CHAB 5784]|nr:hypothetical protein [Nostoc mirabile CHAB5784]